MVTHILERIFRSPIHLFLLAFTCMSNIRSSSSIDWLHDSVEIAIVPDAAEFILTMSASRDVLPSTSGHFKLRVVANGVELNTSCISYGASDSEVSEALVALDPVDDLGGVSVIREGNGSSAFGYGYKYHIKSITSTQLIVDVVDIKFLGSGTAFGCSKIVTVGYWDDAGNWETKTVPGSHDEVYIPVDSGLIVLEHDTLINALEMRGGALVTHSSTCLPRWTPAPRSASVSSAPKCYRIFTEALPWASAQTACASAVSSTHVDYRGGSLGATLVAVQDSDEHRWVARLCSGGTTSGDCWVGGQGTTWANAQGVEDPQHRSRASGGSSTPGDEGKRRCPAMRSLSKSALDQEEGGWYDDECEAEKPFVCQAFGVSTPFSLTVASQLRILGGYIIGSGMVESASDAQVSDDVGEVGLLEGATLVNSGTMGWSAGRSVGWGGTLENQALLTLSGSVNLSASWDSEGFARRSAQARPLLLNQGTGSILIQEDYSVGVQWLLWNEGGQVLVSVAEALARRVVELENLEEGKCPTGCGGLTSIGHTHPVEGNLHATGGGHSSAGKIVVDTPGVVTFSNCSFKMDQSETVVVDLHADREVTGRDVEDPSDGGGYYRLAFAGEGSGCIGYHATAKELEMMLEELDAVRKVGGVSVRREGDGSSRASRFGYRHLIAFDGGRDLSFGSDTPVSLTLSCVGSAEGCHCTDVTGPIPGPGGSRTGCGRSIFGAGNGSTSARFSEAACVVQAWVEVETLRRGGETIVSGRGVLAFSDGGQYLLPSIVEADMHVSSGAEVLCAQWKTELAGAINATQGGVLWFAGGNWEALDAVRLLHAAPTTFGRNATSIASPPTFNATVSGSVLVAADSKILLAATPSSTVDIAGVLTLRGGSLSGSGRLRVRGEILVLSHSLNASGDWKDTTRPTGMSATEFPSSLRDGLILDLFGGGRWIGGEVHVLDGVRVVNRGRFKITAEGSSFGKHTSLKGRPRLHFDGIGWYPNPLCREKCMAEPLWQNPPGGELLVDGTGNARLCFSLQNEGTVRVEDGSLLDVCGDGEGGASGTLHLPGTNSTLRISAGKLHLEARANVTGKGILEFSGGQGHELAETMLPLVKVSGDARVAFSGNSLFLGRGLTVMDRAIINFSTVSSRIHLEGDLTVCGNGMLTFPAPRVEDSSLRHDFGVSSPPWRDEEGDLDGGDGWGAPSRSSMWIQGNFLWAGGTFDGNARAVSAGESTWLCELRPLCSVSTTKRLVNSFHLVNDGDTQWYHGDVLLFAGAAFVNRGTLRLPNTSSPKPHDLCHHGFEGPRIRAPRQGEWSESRTRTSTALTPFDAPSDAAVAGGAGSDAGAAANWAWEGSNYQGT